MSPSIETLQGILEDIGIDSSRKEQLLIDIWSWFFWVSRKDGSHYIEHLIKTLLYTEKYDESFDDISVQIAVLHDSIEDTNESFESLQLKYGDIVALWVDTLSKKPFWEYIPGWEDSNYEQSNDIQNFLILKDNIEKYIWREIDHDFKFSNHSNIPHGLRKLWEVYEEKYEVVRNNQYFWKFKNMHELEKNIENQAIIRWVILDKEELQLLAYKVAVIKLSDRKHNIETLPKKKRAYKIKETQEHLSEIGKEVVPRIWKKISHRIKKYVQEEIVSRTQNLIWQQ